MAEFTAEQIPGSLNAGWDYYFSWAEKNHAAWSALFKSAEEQRVKESKLWREYYQKVYKEDNAWWKKTILFALNGIQLWALTKQFLQQKELADRTYEVADRQQKIAEELFDFYNAVYKPQEDAMSAQLAGSTTCADYTGTGGMFGENVRRAFDQTLALAERCSSSNCERISDFDRRGLAIERALTEGNAKNHAYRYAEARKEAKDNMWLELRIKWIQVGRNASQQGQQGIMSAFGTFSSFGADPGAALSTLLGTLSNTVGQMISSPVSPDGTLGKMAQQGPLPYAPFLGGIRQSGDIQPTKGSKSVTRSF
jgi:hypothetical protein